MLIPDYWAEAILKHRVAGKQITVRRFGWSEQNQGDAQRNADERAEDAFARLVAGEKLARSEAKVSYNGAFGLPIREQVLSRYDYAVITRNIYGARCLNTPDVLFADIDFKEASGLGPVGILVFLMAAVGSVLLASATLGRMWYVWWPSIALFLLMLKFGFMPAARWLKKRQQMQSNPEQEAVQRVDAFLKQHPDWRIRLYRTPAGLRLLAMHKTFDPADPEVAEFFKQIHADKIYVRMCSNQHCFRARVSPKPWRIGIKAHLKPRPGIWPINPERLPDREQWVNEYERKSESFASCRYIADMGNNYVDTRAEQVRVLHDELCYAESDKPLA